MHFQMTLPFGCWMRPTFNSTAQMPYVDSSRGHSPMRAAQHPTRKSVGYFGALRSKDGKLVYRREQNMFNAETFWAFMKKLRQTSCHTGRRVMVILDDAHYHHALLHSDWRKRCAGKFGCCFCHPTARILIRWKGCGSLRDVRPLIIAASSAWIRFLKRWNQCLRFG